MDNEINYDVKFITSFVVANPDMENVIRHFQIVIVQDIETKKFKLFFDVLDPTKLPKFAEEKSE